MPILELTQREFQKLKVADVIPVHGDTDAAVIHLALSDKELEVVRDSRVIWFEGEDVPVTLSAKEFHALQTANLFPVDGKIDGEQVICNLSKDQWRLYQKFALKQKRAARKQRKNTVLTASSRKGVCCPACGLVLLNYEKMMEHHQTHDEKEVKYLFS